MARETSTVQVIARAGLEPSYTAAAADGNSFANSGREFAHIKNGSASSMTVTVQTPGTVDGLAVADRTVAIPAGEERMIGSFAPAQYNQGNGTVYLDYSDESDVTLAVIRL